MPIDYSKWDNLELSDDSDVEIHPNIERGTFLRLRQRKIREERENRRLKKERAAALVEMNADLIKQVTTLRNRVAAADEAEMDSISRQWEQDVESARAYKEKRDAAAKNGEELGQPTDDEMLAALKARISDDLLNSAVSLDTVDSKRSEFVGQLDAHIGKLKKSLADAKKELEDVTREIEKHIAPDSITHEGFDHSFVSKGNSSTSSGSKPVATRAEKETVVTNEVLNPGSIGKFDPKASTSSASNSKPVVTNDNDDIDENGDLKLDNDAKEFASLTSMSDSMDYIQKHLSIVSSAKSDQILGHAFTHELAGRKKLAKQYVRQSLILTYILQMGPSGVNVFFSRMGAKGKPQEMFEAEINSRYKHIEDRCKVIQSEGAKESDEPVVESIQLQCDDPNAPIRISVPDESSENNEDPHRIELFHQLPENFRNALKEGTLEAINKVLADMSGTEAERLLAICGEGNFLGIDGEVVIDPNEQQQE
ncbi:hypothetical protein BX070DRAFT_236428 [Coemansia spiralis]|nr:hypothetical protein BX070DRAFT_236428 [Coemansia spiralis]